MSAKLDALRDMSAKLDAFRDMSLDQSNDPFHKQEKSPQSPRLSFEMLKRDTIREGARWFRFGFVPRGSDTWDYSQAGAGVIDVSVVLLRRKSSDFGIKRGSGCHKPDRLNIELVEGAALPQFTLRQKRELIRQINNPDI